MRININGKPLVTPTYFPAISSFNVRSKMKSLVNNQFCEDHFVHVIDTHWYDIVESIFLNNLVKDTLRKLRRRSG